MSATASREKVVERLVAWIWEQQALVGALPADDGRQYQVVFRGRGWGERSPDFQGAILARDDGLLLRGDVEIHVRASDWKRHGHGRNPAYNQTVCQVVLWQDEPLPIRRQDGTTIPTIEIVTCLAAPLAELEQRAARQLTALPMLADHPTLPPARTGRPAATPLRAPAVHCVQTPADLATLLDDAGVARFLEHAATFESDLACQPPDEVLYRGALRAMGYTANTSGFEQLGQALPLATLRAVAAQAWSSTPREDWDSSDGTARILHVQAALLGVAGLLPGQRGLSADDGWPEHLEAAWARIESDLATPLPPGTWKSWRVRPENVPVRRIAGLSQLLTSWRTGDPLDGLLDDLAAAEQAANPALLAARWQARADDDAYWASHHDFGKPLPAPQPWLVGAGRAAEIVVNVLLPFGYALGQATSDTALSERALAIYRRYPSGPPNRVVREMAFQVGGADGPRLARGACRQQGLIHLYRHWCDTRDCASCAARATAEAGAAVG
ncbi:MAG: DUF2851 family protein [Chloroflexota bacterium]